MHLEEQVLERRLLLKSLQVGEKNLIFSKSSYSETLTYRWGKRTKEHEPPLQVYILKGLWEKVM